MMGLDNRELALLVWIVVLLVVVVSYPKTREGLSGIWRQIFASKLTFIFGGILGYAIALVYGLWMLGFWTEALVPETVLWILGPGMVLVYGMVTKRDSDDFFKETLKNLFVVTLALEFVLNLYPFPLIVEILLVPVLVLLLGALAAAERDPQLQGVRRLLEIVVALVGFTLFGYTIWQILRHPANFATGENLRIFLLPILLTVAYVPLLYALHLYVGYENAFIWIRFAAEGRSRRRRAKLAVLSIYGPRARDLRAFTPYWGNQITQASSLREARRVVVQFRDWARERRLAPMREEERLARYTGVSGVDDYGRQLDQREFKETKKALRFLATAQMGWYRNQGERYRTDLLEKLQLQFERAGLPDDHGIELRITSDGQSWWAWRRIVTGWCLGVGADGPPPDEWNYDQPDPPDGPPSDEKHWTRWGADAANW